MINQNLSTAAALPLPIPLDAAAARQELDRILREFIATALRPRRFDATPPALALRVSLGLGKTTTTLQGIADHGEALLIRGHVMIYMPTLELAEEAHAQFKELAPRLPSAVIRGRSAKRPDQDAPMCERHELAARIAAFVPSVTRALCADAEGVQAPCFAGCPYLAQRDIAGSQVLFLSHQYLMLRPPIAPNAAVALRVIDESFVSVVARTRELKVGDLMRASSQATPDDLCELGRAARTETLHALQAGLPVRAHLASAGIDRAVLKRLARAEARSRADFEVRPDEAETDVLARWVVFDAASFIASTRRQQLFRMLADGGDPGCERISFATRANADPASQAIRIHELRALPDDAPILMLDADAEPLVVERLVPKAQFIRIDAPAQAHVVQVSDVAGSNHWMLHHDQADEHRAQVVRMIRNEVARAGGRGVLLVATRDVLRALHADAGQPNVRDSDLEATLHGASPRWFGPRLRGLNRFAAYATVVIVGRLQPRVDDIESLGRALFGDGDKPLTFSETDRLAGETRLRLMSAGDPREAPVQSHPDPRIDTILRQVREASSTQAVGRLRLMTPDQPKRVVLISNLPLPGLAVNELTTFEALADGLEQLATRRDHACWRRLSAALRRPDGRLVDGVRLSPAGLAADLPRGVMTQAQAKELRRGRPRATMLDLLRSIADQEGRDCTPIVLTDGRRGGHPVDAVILAPAEQAVAVASQIWPWLDARLIEIQHGRVVDGAR